MPPKMIREMPLPMPFSVMSSPIQTRKMSAGGHRQDGGKGGQSITSREADATDSPGALEHEQLAVALEDRQGHGQPVGVEGYLVPPRLAFLGQRLKGGNDGNKELHDDGGGDVGVDTHSGDAQPAQGATREEVEIAQDSVPLEGVLELLRVRSRDGHVGNKAEHDQQAQGKEKPPPDVRLLERLHDRLQQTGHDGLGRLPIRCHVSAPLPYLRRPLSFGGRRQRTCGHVWLGAS